MSGGASVLTGLGSSVKLSGEDWVASCRPIVKAAAKGSDVSGLPGAVFVHTIGRFSALLSPRDAVTLNLTNIALLFIADLSLNDSSSRRQNSSDNVKRSDEIAMEQPWAVAGVLSLSGVGSLVIHRYVRILLYF